MSRHIVAWLSEPALTVEFEVVIRSASAYSRLRGDERSVVMSLTFRLEPGAKKIRDRMAVDRKLRGAMEKLEHKLIDND
jgi:hypothetical protein